MISPPANQLSRAFYAVALIAFGIQHLLFNDFITGRAPAWPVAVSGQMLFAYSTGLLLIITGIATILNKKAGLFLALAGSLILLWSGLRNIYELVIQPTYGGLLTNTCKALSLGAGAFIVAQTFQAESSSPISHLFIKRMAAIGHYLVALFLLIAGIQHFLFAEFVRYLIPTWIPCALFWTYFSGVALAAAGIGIITSVQSSLAAMLSGYMILAWVYLLHLPRAIANANQNEWTAVFEAFAVSGILLITSKQRAS